MSGDFVSEGSIFHMSTKDLEGNDFLWSYRGPGVNDAKGSLPCLVQTHVSFACGVCFGWHKHHDSRNISSLLDSLGQVARDTLL